MDYDSLQLRNPPDYVKKVCGCALVQFRACAFVQLRLNMFSHNRRTGAVIVPFLCVLPGCHLQPLLRGCAGVLVC